MKNEEQKTADKKECDHEWKPLGTTQGDTHVKLKCVKCGQEKLIELFP